VFGIREQIRDGARAPPWIRVNGNKKRVQLAKLKPEPENDDEDARTGRSTGTV
jgi:hypothetical protein